MTTTWEYFIYKPTLRPTNAAHGDYSCTGNKKMTYIVTFVAFEVEVYPQRQGGENKGRAFRETCVYAQSDGVKYGSELNVLRGLTVHNTPVMCHL